MKAAARPISDAAWAEAQAERRATHAAYVAKWREEQRKKKQCRNCTSPAARGEDGRLMSACNGCLNADADRQKAKRAENKKAKSK